MATHNLLVVADTTSFRIKPPINKNHTPKVSDAMIEEAQKKINSTDTTSEYTLDLFVVLDDRLRKVGLGILKIYKGSGRRYDGKEIEEPDCEIEWLYPTRLELPKVDKQIDEFARRIIVAFEDYYYTTEDALHA